MRLIIFRDSPESGVAREGALPNVLSALSRSAASEITAGMDGWRGDSFTAGQAARTFPCSSQAAALPPRSFSGLRFWGAGFGAGPWSPY